MIYTISPADAIGGSTNAPPSKSYTIRAILSSLLADGTSTINAPLISRDTQAAYNACRMFGGTIEDINSGAEVCGVGGKPKTPDCIVDTLNSGTTIRLCTAIASLCEGEVTLTGDGSIQQRPMKHLLDALNQLGTTSSSANGCPPLKIRGPLTGGKCSIVGDISSQFITAILMAAPYAKEDVEVGITTDLKSKPYVDMTINMLKTFGIKVEKDRYRSFRIPCGQTYKPTEYTVEGDYSSAAFILGAAAITESKVCVGNLFKDSLQADKKIVEIISEMGAKVKVKSDSVSVESDGRLRGGVFDLSDSPDLVPIVCAIGTSSKGETEIVNAAHARLKECDRIKAMVTELRKMGADIDERRDGVVIHGGKKLTGDVVNGWCDHRIIMALSVAALKANSDTTIEGAEHVDVTFPEFKDVMSGLGARII